MDHVTATLLDCLVMRSTGFLASTTTPSLQPVQCKNEIIRQLAEAWRGIFSRIVERGWVLLWRYVPPQFLNTSFYSSFIFSFTYTQFFHYRSIWWNHMFTLWDMIVWLVPLRRRLARACALVTIMSLCICNQKRNFRSAKHSAWRTHRLISVCRSQRTH